MGDAGAPSECFAMVDLRYLSASPPPSQPEAEVSPVGLVRSRAWPRSASQFEDLVRRQSDFADPSQPPPCLREVRGVSRKGASRKLVLELAGNLRGVSLMRYSSLRPLSPLSPQPQTSTSNDPFWDQEGFTSPESSPSVTEDNDRHLTVEDEMRAAEAKRWEGWSRRPYRFDMTLNEEEGDSGTETPG